MRKTKKIFALILCTVLTVYMCGISVMAAGSDTITYDISKGNIVFSNGLVAQGNEATKDASGTVVITGSSSTYAVTVKDGNYKIELDNASITSASSSAIELDGSANVALTISGENTLKASTSTVSAGIYVSQTAKLTVDGSGTLNVTGGKYGAGIGSLYEKVNGDIIINGGIINAVGGDRGAGIGSGYHTSAGNIVINGGNITAIGIGCGAGIGTGYGTSGGGEGKVGTYNGGNITITGGTVHAAPFAIDFSKVDAYDPSCLTSYDNNSFAAGIGGGYGSGSGNISITGGDVIALGSCGGAGIGAGRGTSKASNYDANAFFVNISISGTAKVLAMATDDVRNHKGGGAAIGAGRGSHTGGTIFITGKADVTAIASPYASAIGSASNVSPVDGTTPTTDSITITNGVTLYAVSDGTRYAIDTSCGTKSFDTISENVHQILFDSSLVSDTASTTYDLTTNGEVEKEIVIPAKMKSVATNVAKSGTYYLKSGNLYGVQLSDSTQYGVSNSLSEQTCVKFIEYTEPESTTSIPSSAPYQLTNNSAYLFGRTNTEMQANDEMLRGEACAVIYRLLKQNNKLGDFVYDESATPAFADLGGRWDRSAIEYMAYIGAYKADATGNINGSSPIKRGEAFKIFALSLGFTTDTTLTEDDYASILKDRGYVEGYDDGSLGLDNNITRAEYVTIYNKIIGRDKLSLMTEDGVEVTPETYGFTDIADDWSRDEVLKATSAYDDNGKVDIEKRAERNNLDDYE